MRTQDHHVTLTFNVHAKSGWVNAATAKDLEVRLVEFVSKWRADQNGNVMTGAVLATIETPPGAA